MVPFCEFLNHECIDVYYDFEYKDDNIHKPKDYVVTEPYEEPLTEEDENE